MKLSKRRHTGFTILEVLAVLMILSILAAIAIPNVSSLNNFQVTPEAEIIKGHLRYAQTRAIDTSAIWGINFASGSYTLFNSITGSTPLLPGINSATVTLPAGMTITEGIVSFDTWGTPYTDNAAASVQNVGGYRAFNLTSGTTTAVVQIADNTGYIP
jgi:MSHA pilin protein MshC